MFKWMISGHKTHKHKGKLNNALNNSTSFNSNNNNNSDNNKALRTKTKQDDDVTAVDADSRNNNNNYDGRSHHGQPKEWSQSHQNLSSSQELQLDGTNDYSSLDPIPLTDVADIHTGQRMRSVEHINSFSSFKPTVNGSSDHIPPPLPNPRVNPQGAQSFYPSGHHLPHQEPLPQAPGTCTLPRRALHREHDSGAKIRSPSNPPGNCRHPPPYSRHQPPEPTTPRARRPYQPPPPPRHQAGFERLTAPTTRNGPEANGVSHQPLANGGYPAWKESDSWQARDPDSGFESISAQNDSHLLFRAQPDRAQLTDPFDHVADNLASKSSENLINASKVTEALPSRIICTPPKPKSAANAPPRLPTREDHLRSYEKQSFVNNTEILESDSVYPTTESRQIQLPSDVSQYTEANIVNGHSRYNGYARPVDSVKENGLSSRQNVECSIVGGENTRTLSYSKPDSPYKYASTLKQYQSQFCGIEVKRKDSFKSRSDDERSAEGWKSLYIKEPQDTAESLPVWMSSAQGSNDKCPNVDTKQGENEQRIGKENGNLPALNTQEKRGCDSLKVTDVRPSLRYAPDSQLASREQPDNPETVHRKEKIEDRKVDGCPSSTSWSEWTNQLQAYVSWTNSQLRKKSGSELISDLRRDFLNGIVFGDIIEVIAGEKVFGINKNASTPQQCRDNLDKVLQFMAAKRIRMTNITSKEIVEGNMKSIMRVILALASHYKPQSVGDSGHSESVTTQNRRNSEAKSQRVSHDIGVGPDPLVSAPEKTPSLVRKQPPAHQEESEPVLRRQPSLTSTVRSSSPVYENLPKRSNYGRWAYDSMRASHKFQWNPKEHQDPLGSKPLEAESIGSSFNTSLSKCPSLNVSLDENSIDSKNSLAQTRPAALEFWKGLQTNEDFEQVPKDTDESSPFRYHTVHRMSGRRKLPQIPGKASPCSSTSRVTTPQGDIFSNEDNCRSMQSNSICGSFNEDETSREPEGRSQNSSPATSIVRGSLIESWRGTNGIESWKDKDNFGATGNPGSSCGTMDNNMKNMESTALRQEVIRHIVARQVLETDKDDLARNLQQRENLILELRQQLNQKDKTLQIQKQQLDETVHQLQNGKLNRPSNDITSRGQAREELQLVRGAIGALRSNFRETDPSQHTLDTLEQAIAILMERSPTNVDSLLASKKEKYSINKMDSSVTKVIYFTERTVTPFMSTINKRIGDITLRDFKAIFDRPGFYRFHFKNHDPEYGLVKEEIINDEEILPGIDGKIIAWVEDEVE